MQESNITYEYKPFAFGWKDLVGRGGKCSMQCGFQWAGTHAVGRSTLQSPGRMLANIG